jgi:hypothetical protein
MAPAGRKAPKPQQLPDRYRIVASDPFSSLPIIETQNLGTPSSHEMRIEQIVRTLSFTALARSQILEVLPDCPFLPAITVGDTVTVSCQSRPPHLETPGQGPRLRLSVPAVKSIGSAGPGIASKAGAAGLRLEYKDL